MTKQLKVGEETICGYDLNDAKMHLRLHNADLKRYGKRGQRGKNAKIALITTVRLIKNRGCPKLFNLYGYMGKEL